MGLKKATRSIIISDESVNAKGFWTRTAGIDLSLYTDNPILLWNHDRTRLPIGVIQDLHVKGEQLIGTPAFDEEDTGAMEIARKYELGMINMSSAGLQPIEVLKDKKHCKGTAICLSKSMLAEISLTDIGANRGARKVSLFHNGAMVELKTTEDLVALCAPITKDKLPNMNTTLELKDVLVALNLSADTADTAALDAIKKLGTEVVTLRQKATAAEDALVALQKTVAENKVVALVDAAVTAKKIDPAEKEHYVKLATADFDTVEKLLKGMKPYTSLADGLEGKEAKETNQAELDGLIKLSGDELFRAGKFERLKELSEPHYKLKYKEAFGEEPK